MMRRSKLLFLVLMCVLSLPVYAQKKNGMITEIVYPGGAKERQKLKKFLAAQEMLSPSDIYEWKNHIVIYDGEDPELWSQLVKEKFKDCKVKLYNKPFYNFERSKCSDKTVAKQWDNIILTANLVADPKKQQEYLNYHKTQFEKWPEVSQGFCNASFQQLLVFRNGRQLMLIISIPKGESLDKLNPLTTKNNPRVNEWNKIMAKYQEGIEGTAKGETWVFLKPYIE
jgi:hypothetical protein